MRYLTQHSIFCLLIAFFVLSGCSAGRSAFSKGEDFEAEGKYEEAMYSYADAFKLAPDVGEYRTRFFKARDKASEKRFKMGMDQYDRGDYVGALAEFQTAYALDPTQSRFKQKADETIRLRDAQLAFQEGIDFEKSNKLKDASRAYAAALELHPANKEYQEAVKRIAGQRKSKLVGYELSLKSHKPITLKFKDAKIKDVFTIITQLTGIGFIFDEGVKDHPVSIYLENATFQQALDLLINMNKLDNKILNESTVLIYPRTPEKSKQYQDLTIRTFHLSYMEAKKAINLVRTLVQVKKIHVVEESNSLVVRDTSDVVNVVEKILDANDVPDPEVVLEVEVIEVSDTNARKLGLILDPYNVQLGAYKNSNLIANSISQAVNTVIPGTTTTPTTTTTPATTTSTPATQTINLIKAFSGGHPYSAFITVPNATYNFGKTLTDGEVLSNPKLRVKNKEKAKFNVGTRIPIVTTTVSSGTLSQANVQYVDVGVKLNAEPNIQLNNEIIIKLSLEVSQQIGGIQNVSGASVVTIGTRNLDTVLSLKDGETSIIGGLREYRSSNSKNTIAILGEIPLLGPLFSGYDNKKDKTELILAITPRLVRHVTVPPGDLMSFVSGKEDDPTLQRPMASFDQEPVYEDPAKSQGSKQPVSAPAMPVKPVSRQPVAAPVIPAPNPAPAQQVVPPAPPVIATPAIEPAAKPANIAPAAISTADAQKAPATVPAPIIATATPPQPAKRGLLQLAAPATIGVGQQFFVDVKVADIQGLAKASYALTFDSNLVDFISVSEGSFLKKGGQPTTFNSTPASGVIIINQSQPSTSGGATGAGSLVSVLFKTKNKGPASFGFRSVVFTAADGKPLELLPFSTAVDVR